MAASVKTAKIRAWFSEYQIKKKVSKNNFLKHPNLSETFTHAILLFLQDFPKKRDHLKKIC